MTQAQLAKAVNAEQSTISGYESDPKRQPSRARILELAQALKVTPEHLEFGGATDQSREFSYEGEASNQPSPAGAEIDAALLAQCIEMAMTSLVASYGVAIPKKRFEDATDAAISAYHSYFRLKADEDSHAA